MTRSQKIFNLHQMWHDWKKQTKWGAFLKRKNLVKLIIAIGIKNGTGFSETIEELLIKYFEMDRVYKAFLDNPDMEIEIQPVINFINKKPEQNLSQERTKAGKS